MLSNPWTILADRADKAGKMLARVLVEGHHGNRPVTLIGACGRLVYLLAST